MNLPDPLHPVIVHFPIVLLLVGLLLAAMSLVLRKPSMYLATSIVIGFGALGSSLAVSTGEREGEAVWLQSEAAEELLDEHEDWAEKTQTMAWISFAVSAVVLLLRNKPTLPTVGAGILSVVMFITSYCIYQTGHRGGQLVYAYGAGVNPGQVTSYASETVSESSKSNIKSHQAGDDDG